MNIELTFMEISDLKSILNIEITKNEKNIETFSNGVYTNYPSLLEHENFFYERNKKLLEKLESQSSFKNK